MASTQSGAPQNQADDYSDFLPVHDYRAFEPVPWANDPVVGQLDIYEPWTNDPVVGQLDGSALSSGYATTFADQADLAAYHNAIANRASEEEALKVGDNGISNGSVSEHVKTIV